MLIQTEVGKAATVVQAIREIAGVTLAEDVTGPYDVIVRAEASTVDDLGKLVVARIQAVGGITRLGPMHPLDADQFLNGTAIILKKDNVDLNLGCAAWWTQPGAPADTAFSLVDESAGAGAVAGPPSYVTGGLAVDTSGNRQQCWSANGGAIGPAPALRRRLEVPLLLAQLVQFNIVLRVSRPITFLSVDQGGTNGFSARWDFWGTESSPVGRT